ncbi:S1/P1 nuclease [Sphingomicrobium astaxanthinifaciens]|uniref:S1/P1 nuclease n=1 Tax=Sphingomicrobium astaxanthinifaciens TaxID=1227949 RepID=UPI001FCC81B1|nr:S1/P1 nuclease [Sphingomicrobium astaxanthinifaciens]MCJ7421094.1 S1/P1 nuclease [Sphingomicrobium astaxanthinifaciens]
MIRFLAATLAACSLFIASPAAAYWEYGHGLVARIAMNEVRPETRAAIRALLAQGHLLETPGCSVATVEDASYWADCIKPMGDRYAYAFPWHYQNVNICKPFDLGPACEGGNCVAAQVERNARLLADHDLPTSVRVEALAFLLHFVGDLHQPMHAGDMGDRGGNDVEALYGVIDETNLHAIWDGYLAERAFTTPPGGPEGLVAGYDRADLDAFKQGDVVDWSRDMWEVSKTYAYPLLLDADPCDAEVERPVLSQTDIETLVPVMRQSAVKGGMRLARLLDEALLGGKAPRFRRF